MQNLPTTEILFETTHSIYMPLAHHILSSVWVDSKTEPKQNKQTCDLNHADSLKSTSQHSWLANARSEPKQPSLP